MLYNADFDFLEVTYRDDVAFRQELDIYGNFMNNPPIAGKKPSITNIHGMELQDDYAWLRDHNWPDMQDREVLDYLIAENKYAESIMAESKDRLDAIYNELKGRVKLEDTSVPVKEDDYFYYTRVEADGNYVIYARKHMSLDSKEEIYLDENKLAENHEFFYMGDVSISEDHKLVAYSSDVKGDERYTVYVKDITTGRLLEDIVEGTIGEIVWHNDNNGFFYTKVNDSWRSDKIYFHKLGTKQEDDRLIYQEQDVLFQANITKSGSKEVIFIFTESKDSSETWYLSSDTKDFAPKLVTKREEGLLYYVDHIDNEFFIRTNDSGKNFRLVKAEMGNTSHESWQEVIAENGAEYLEAFDLYANKLVLTTKMLGLSKIKIMDLATNEVDEVKFDEAAYTAYVDFTTFDAKAVRIVFSAFNTPTTVFEYDFSTHQMNTLKVREIPSGFNKEDYQVERVMVEARDGVLVPVSLVYKKELFQKDGSNPLFLYGYGSYGISIPPQFNSNIVTLLDRGFVYAISHIRGGDDLGYAWYEDTKFLNKKRTFEDFIDSAKFLIEEGYTKEQNIVIGGGSAGGMLVGAVTNEIPHLLKASILDVPFVDVLNTMLDDTLPLTPGEFKEWGNPKEKEYFDYILSYSPYDNIKAQDYPAIFVAAGLSDPRVTYWEPAKYVAKMREMKTDDNLLVFETDMAAGHKGASGRFGRMKELSRQYNFIFEIFDIKF